MKKDYFVLAERNIGHEKDSNSPQVYMTYKEFKDYNQALTFSNRNLPSILAKKTPLTEAEKQRIKDSERPYVVTAHFRTKYETSCMGEVESFPANEAIRCTEDKLETIVTTFAKNGGEKIVLGIELKVLGGLLE